MNISRSEWTLETFLTHVSLILYFNTAIADGWVIITNLLKSVELLTLLLIKYNI